MSYPDTLDAQPLSTLKWVEPESLHANDFNPNKVFGPEMRLLKISIMESGWTQPIVALEDGTIVDGFHRWSLGLKDADVRSITGGLVPVVTMRNVGPEHHRMATIRHNRARGQHGVVRMAAIVQDLVDLGIEDEEIARRAGMEIEEVERMKDRGSMIKRRSADALGSAWAPDEKPEDVKA